MALPSAGRAKTACAPKNCFFGGCATAVMAALWRTPSALLVAGIVAGALSGWVFGAAVLLAV